MFQEWGVFRVNARARAKRLQRLKRAYGQGVSGVWCPNKFHCVRELLTYDVGPARVRGLEPAKPARVLTAFGHYIVGQVNCAKSNKKVKLKNSPFFCLE